jgi:hypothetical protein
MKKSLIVLCVVIVTCSLLTVLLLLKLPSAPSSAPALPTPINTVQPTNQALQQAINRGITYLRQTEHPLGLLMLNVIYRQFGIAEFKDSLQRYDQLYASSTDPLIRVWRRIADYNTSAVQPEDFDSVIDQLNRLTIPALYSDRISLPDDYLSQLTDAMEMGFIYAAQPTDDGSINDGAYLLTHVLLATIWLQNNNCSLQLPEDFTSTLYQMNAALIGDGSRVDDIQLEAAAFLYQAGQGNLVHPDFAENVIATQNPDGGWSISSGTPNGSDWHPSVLALMILLYVAYPAASYPPMLASAPS